MSRRAGCGGFSLVEVAVVTAVLGVLASMALPSIAQQFARWNLQSAAQRLASDIGQARHEAARQGRTLHLQVQPGERWCWSVSEVPGCTCQEARHCQRQLARASDHPGVVVETAATLSFSPTAHGPGAPSSLLLSSRHGEQLEVRLTPLGRARVCAPDRPRMGQDACG